MLQLIIERIFALLPAPLHRVALRRAHGLRKLWWRIRKPQVEACRILALDSEGRVLLVRHSYGSARWMPPGGGMKAGEDPIRAAARELFEELACSLGGAQVIATTFDTLHGAGNLVHVVRGQCQGLPTPDRREILAAGFFAADALPDDLARGLDSAIPAWLAA
jgi:8-oxo-dGTP pyrophosphatase MutT (NUDIX family)